MQPPGITPAPGSDPDIAWLIGQHERDLAALDRAADRIAELEARCVRYARDQASLIVMSRRDKLL